MDAPPNANLDVTGDICPTTFIKTKLELEDLPAGAILTVRVREGSSLDNVSRSVAEDGHTILSRNPDGAGIVRLVIRRS